MVKPPTDRPRAAAATAALASRRQALSDTARAALAERLRAAAARSGAGRGHPAEPIPRTATGHAPLSATQERFWLRQRAYPQDTSANVFLAVRLRGELDLAALRLAYEHLPRRHAVLGSRFPEVDGVPAQWTPPGQAHPPLRYVALDGAPQVRSSAALAGLALAEVNRPFDLAGQPPIRATLVRLAEHDHALLLTMHHIATDAASNAVLLEDLAASYQSIRRGQPLAEPATALRFADYASWQRDQLAGATGARCAAYWQAALAGVPHAVDLPIDRPPVTGPPDRIRSGRLVTELPAAVMNPLRACCHGEHTSQLVGLLAVLQTLILRWTGMPRFLVGIPISGRTRPELDRLVGPVFSTVAVAADLTGPPTFRELLRRATTAAAGAFNHAALPADRLLAGNSRLSPYDVLLAMQQPWSPHLELPGLVAEPLEFGDGTAQCALTVSAAPLDQDLRLTIDYDADRFEPATVTQLAGHLDQLTRSLATAPDQPVTEAAMLTAPERSVLLGEHNRTAATNAPVPVLHEMVAARAADTPLAPAVSRGTEVLNYAELWRRAVATAGTLAELGVRRGDVVGVSVERDTSLPVALLAVLAAGAAFLPLDPAHPVQRRGQMLADAGARLALTGYGDQCRLPTATVPVVGPDDWLAPSAGPPQDGWRRPAVTGADLAYVMFTSGSTGRPKGVAVGHEGVCNDLVWRQRLTGLAPGDRLLHTVSAAFDPSVWQLFGPLVTGAEVVLADDRQAADPAAVVRLIRDNAITIADFVPAQLDRTLALAEPADLRTLRHVFCGGERLTRRLAERFHSVVDAALHNQYGPTEATIDTTSHPVLAADRHPEVGIGRPIANKRVYLLDRHLTPVPARVPGELWIGGVGLADGYLGEPALTAERFRPDPYAGQPAEAGTGPRPAAGGARMYRSGDLARYRHDGVLEFLGRVDQQVKVNGVRIEPAEIADALREHPDVADAAVTVRPVRDRPALVGYVVPAADAPDHAAVREHLLRRLPSAYVPAHLVTLPAIPLGRTGKVDLAALPGVELNPVAGPGPVAAAGSTAARLAELWRELLDVPQVPLDADFFSLGGDSLLAVRLVAAVRERFGVTVPLPDFLAAGTVARVAELVAERATEPEPAQQEGLPTRPAGPDGPPPLVRRTGDRVPLSYAQRRVVGLAAAGAGPDELTVRLTARLRGELDQVALQRALDAVVARHEALRIAVDGDEQVVLPPYRVTAGPAPCLRTGRLFTAEVAELGPAEHQLVLRVHRVAVDGVATAVLVEDLAGSYQQLCAGQQPELPALAVQHPDFAAWERGWLTAEVVEDAVRAWLRATPGLDAIRALPRPAGNGRRARTHTMSARQLRALRALAQQHRCTVRTVLLTALASACARRLGPLPVCVPVDGRHDPRLRRAVGRFVNLAVVPAPGDPPRGFAARLERTQATAVAAYREQLRLPFTEIERAVAGDRSARQVFPVMFDLAEHAEQTTGLGPGRQGAGIVVEQAGEHWTDFGLALHAGYISTPAEPGRLELVMLHDPDRYPDATVTAIRDDLIDDLDRATAGSAVAG